MADRVAFTNSAAKRIARAVIAYEEGDRNGAGLNLGSVPMAVPPPLRLGTFTGNWETGTYNTVTITGTTNTVSVYNWCNPALGADTSSTTKTRYVIFGKVGGTNSAVEIQMRSTATECTATMTLGSFDLTTLPGYEVGVIQLLGHAAGSTTGDTS